MLKIHQRYSLKYNHTFGTDIVSDYFSEPASSEELRYVVSHAANKGWNSLVIGDGSNLLFTKPFHGIIIHPVISGINKVDESGSEVLIRAGAGINWDQFIIHCIRNNWHGTENLSLIPGSVGAAPVQNIGAYGVEAKDIIEYVTALDTNTAELKTFSNSACEFGYRDSIFKHGEPNRYIIDSVVFRLKQEFQPVLDYGTIKQEFLEKKHHDAMALRETVISIRQKKLPDPAKVGNAGSFFKNPVISSDKFNQLEKDQADIPHYPAEKGKIKIPAAWLIEKAGWKGTRENEVGTWPLQPLVIVNYGKATGQEIFDFSEKIRNSIKEKFGITLEHEVTLVS